MEYRMYCLAERHLSIAQKTIQAAHAIVEYALKYGSTEEYKHWAEYDKTIIVLDGGNSIDMKNDIATLTDIKHNYEIFMEPDMDNFVTCIAFLADERVFDYETYGRNFEEYCKIQDINNINGEFDNKHLYNIYKTMLMNKDEKHLQWIEILGGEDQAKLKEIISTKRLAQ